MSIGEFVDWHVGRYVGIPPNCHLQLENAAYKLRTLITMRRWSLSLGRVVGHVKIFSTSLWTGGSGGGVVLRKTSVPLIVSPWLYKACKYNYEFSLWHGYVFRARHFSHTENRRLDALNFIQGAFKEDLFRWQKKWIWPELVGNPIKQTNLVMCVCMYSMFTKH